MYVMPNKYDDHESKNWASKLKGGKYQWYNCREEGEEKISEETFFSETQLTLVGSGTS